jgi:hypothetical protein
MNTNITKTWTIELDENEVFARCTNESLYQAYNRMAENQKGDAIVMQEDDRVQFKVYFANAVANLHMALARRMSRPSVDYCGDCGTVVFYLEMHDNHDDNVLPMLINHCYEYAVRKVIEQWYRIDMGSELEMLEIKHCLHYRKNPVRRRIGPLF